MSKVYLLVDELTKDIVLVSKTPLTSGGGHIAIELNAYDLQLIQEAFK